MLFVSCFIFSGRLFVKSRPTDGDYQESEDPDYVDDPEGDNNEGKSWLPLPPPPYPTTANINLQPSINKLNIISFLFEYMEYNEL